MAEQGQNPLNTIFRFYGVSKTELKATEKVSKFKQFFQHVHLLILMGKKTIE